MTAPRSNTRSPHLSAGALALLEPARGALEPAIRSEIFGRTRFAEHGISLAETHRVVRVSWRAATFFPRVRSNIRVLREAHGFIAGNDAAGTERQDFAPAAEWLLDNFHLIEAQFVAIHDGLPRSYFRSLPLLVGEPLAGLPRIYGVAWAFVAHTDSAFDEDALVGFLDAYQTRCALTLGEMWALPTTLRVVLLENLRRLAEREAAQQAAREWANRCCDDTRPVAAEEWDQRLALLRTRGVDAAFLTQLAQRLTDPLVAPTDELQAWLLKALPDPARAEAMQHAEQTADNLSVSNAVGSLRSIGDTDWPDLVSRTSTLMRRMLSAPAFESLHALTRDAALHGIERLALRSGQDEAAVAEALLARMAAATDAVRAMPGHWLQGSGRPALWRALGLNTWRAVAGPWMRRHLALPLYLLTLAGGTAALVAALLGHQAAAGPWWLPALLMLWPASEVVMALMHRIISESLVPVALPRLALVGGIEPAQRVLVVVPAMLTSTAGNAALAHRLLLHALANPEAQTQFALLTDVADADTETAPDDEALLADARQRIAALNATYAPPGAAGAAGPSCRFLLLHRVRHYSPSEQRWIGWERKRGKLEQLLALLAAAPDGVAASPFVDLGPLSRPMAGTRYLLTLDSDTELPPGRLRELVGVAAHPRNMPRLDGRRVVAGYTILQPQVVTPLPTPATTTPFHLLFAGATGLDPYSAASSEVHQDLFGQGTFCGKGLIDVPAMHAVLGGRLPDGLVLSHDLLEGAIARCAAVSDLAVIEDAPGQADLAAARLHRWTRGDWQLLPLLLRPWRYGLRPLAVWKMLDNLRRSLVAPVSLALLLLALAGWGLTPWAALALGAAAFAAGPLLGALAGCVPRHAHGSWRHFAPLAAADVARALGTGLWQLLQWWPQALRQADAIGRALYRMVVSHHLLLQWTPSSGGPVRAHDSLAEVWRRHRGESLAAAVVTAGLLVPGGPAPGLLLLCGAAWTLAPLLTWWGSRPLPTSRRMEITAQARVHLHGIAHDTWLFFEYAVGAADQHLPPDNVQTLPHEMVAHRTSPTNIGLYLLSVACARQFGWIDSAQMLARLEATFGTLDKLQRHRGHFLNWYDTTTLAPLLPMYVSAVDSGNLCGHLLALGQACLERAALVGEEDHAARFVALAQRCEQLAWEPDFRFLYHRKRHLLHIGWRVAEAQLDASFYDLLASESRLTSLVAIAKGDVPVRHWAALGRVFFAAGPLAGLRSWSGSMFEYLMPTLVLDEPAAGVLGQAGLAAVHEQIAFATGLGVPWGLSESAYAASDHTLAYQYAPQGVPRLALRRTPPDELVVAPYATALAAQVAPRRAGLNFHALERLAARGRWGFIEALDFSPARQGSGARCTPVATFMAHHQGMTLVALANVLLGGVAQRWGMASPRLQALASLLHERAPREVSRLRDPLAGPPAAMHRRLPGPVREVLPGLHALEPTQLLSNGRYSVALRANGAGYSRRDSVGVTRWRDDALRDAQGHFCFVRWSQRPAPVSITQHPAPDPRAHYKARFHADRVVFDAIWTGLHAQTTVWVSPEDDIEFRQVELHNDSDRALEIELLSVFEPSLCEARADEAHPAFMNLFVSAHWHAAQRALRYARTPRLARETALQVAHFVAASGPELQALGVQADRQRWAGRNHAPNAPLACVDWLPTEVPDPAAPPVALGTGLDAVCVLALRLRIEPGAKARVTLATAAADDAQTLNAVIDKYRQDGHLERATLMSATLAAIRLRALELGAEENVAVQTLSTALLLTLTRPHAARSMPLESAVPCDRRLLWRLGISGDRALMLVSISALQGLGLVRTLARALRLWAWAGVACDLVVVNAEPASYLMALQRELMALQERPLAEGGTPPGTTALHVLRADALSGDEQRTLQGLACVWLHADGRPLVQQVQAWVQQHEAAFDDRHGTARVPLSLSRAAGIAAPIGSFDAATGAFSFDVSTLLRPPRPWMNVLANPAFGSQVTEAGGGCTWAGNSRLNQLTAWSNDPVADPPCEWLLLQDLDTHEVWSAAPSAAGDGRALYSVTHAPGHTTIGHRRGDVGVCVTWSVDAHEAVKQVQVQITHHGPGRLRLRVVMLAEWMLGAQRSDRAGVHSVRLTQRQPESVLTALLATQRERSQGFGDSTAFLALLAPGADNDADWTCDRREFFDARGRLVLPEHLGQRGGSGLDPCAALSTTLVLQPGSRVGQQARRVFLLGHAASPDAARAAAVRLAAVAPEDRLAAAQAQSDALLGATTVTTPDPLFDALVNHWLLHQAVACRLWAKAGFYQAGGATGFRDQLQDTLALAWAAPGLLRAQIVLCASRQFVEGDVQHWWHAPGGAGVRTHFSDDLLWLPYACSHYLLVTGDTSVLEEVVPFLAGEPIPEGAEDRYDTPTISAEAATVYDHAARAIDHSLRVGVHGLPLMGSGDWNDGMNRVGDGGRGESVWLAWFLCAVVADFAPLALARGEAERAQRWADAGQDWSTALEGAAWDGRWYRRAFFDSGEPLGSQLNAEARIDLIAQAWSVLSHSAPIERQRLAMASAEHWLVDTDAGLLRLLDPPLVHAQPNAGYIQAYPPGVRENGGQYAHAAVWALMAQARLAVASGAQVSRQALDAPWRSFTWLSPAHRSADAQQGLAYGLEPYVMAGDVCSQPPYTGRGGWSWYTGAAAWMHRAAIESLFGLQLRADGLRFQPCLPGHWARAELTLRRDGRTMRFVLCRALALSEQDAGLPRLQPGAWLDWRNLAAESCHVVPLPDAPALEACAEVLAPAAVPA